MKAKSYLIVWLTASALAAFAQQPQPRSPLTSTPAPAPNATFNERMTRIINQASGEPATALTKFSLDFPGGTPKHLVAAIEKASARPLNVIIAEEHANATLPSLKVTNVDVPQLFDALLKISYKYDNNRNVLSSYGFETGEKNPSEDSIWRFFVYNAAQSSPSDLTRFDLDFPGGTPKQLEAAIEKANGKPLNVVIPIDHAEVKLPPLKMNNVDVSQLFQSLELASQKTETYVISYSGGGGSQQQKRTSYGFKTEGRASDDSIWYFFVEGLSTPPLNTAKASRFYSLAPYLERGLTVDDITTAIQTGWKMQGDTSSPQISFHKETKLLIAVGEPGKLETIDAVLKALPKPAIDPASGLPVPKAEQK